MGGEITVAELPNGQHLINLLVYRDTVGIPMQANADFELKGPNGWSILRTSPYDSVISGTVLPMYPYGVEVYYFSDTLTFPVPGLWHVSWSNCCRNGAIQNLAIPTSDHMYLSTTFNIDTASTNSTAFFLVPAAIYLPLNTAWQYNPLPFDPDGDSLVWSLDLPLKDSAVFCAGYSTPPSASSGPLSLDSVTGTISWTANTVGHFVISILVDQYRNGQWIGEIRRDMQLIVVPSGGGFPYWFSMNGQSPTNTLNISIPNFSPLNFEIVASHADSSKRLSMAAYSPLFREANPAASFSTAPTGIANNLKGTFNFSPDNRHVHKTHLVVFRCSDDFFTTDQTMNIEFTSGIGIKEVLDGQSFANWTLYPNPADNHFNVSFQAEKNQNLIVEMLSLDGRMLMQRKLKAEFGTNLYQFESASYDPGIYLLQFKSNEGHVWSSRVSIY